MRKKDIKKLAQESYTTNELDEKKVSMIAGKLNRKDIKEYIRSLKILERQKEIIIALPNVKSYTIEEHVFRNMFGGKRLIYREAPSIILGSIIIDNDLVYDLSLRNKIEQVTKQMEEQYE